MSETFSVRLPKDQTRFLDRLAKATDRSRNNIVSGAVARLMENHAYVTRLVEMGDADFEAGRIVEMDEVERRTQAVIDRATKR